DDAEDLIALLHQVRDRAAVARTPGSPGDGRSGAEQPETGDDATISIRPQDLPEVWEGSDAATQAASLFEAVTHFPIGTKLRLMIVNCIGMKLRLIPAGEFLLGSPDNDRDAFNDERPQHRVRITRPYYLGVYPVTRGQFRQFVEAISYQTEAEKDGKDGW